MTDLVTAKMEGLKALEASLTRFAGEVKQAVVEAARELPEDLLQDFKGMVEQRKFQYPDNSPGTIYRKGTDVPLIDEHNYLDSWVAYATAREGKPSVHMEPTGINPHRGVPNSALADVLEYGSALIPARPHIRPFQQQMMPTIIAKLVKKVRARALQR